MFSHRDPRRICIIKPSALGDVVQSLPVLAALRQRFPTAEISWVVNREYAPLLEPISLIDEVIPFDRHAMRKRGAAGLLKYAQFPNQLRRRRFDLVIDLQGLLRTGLFTWATLAHRRVGLKSAREGASLFYTHVVDDERDSQAAVDRYWKIVEAFGVGGLTKEFPLSLSTQERNEAARLLASLPRPWIAVQPGARWETKRWPIGSFAETINQAGANRRLSAVLVGSPNERSICETVASRLNVPAINLAGQTTLRTLAAVLEACDVALTNDSGPMHLAAAAGTPVVAIFTCTSPERAGPFGEGHQAVWTQVPCRGSYLKSCSKMDCMRELLPGTVVPILLNSLQQATSTKSKRTG